MVERMPATSAPATIGEIIDRSVSAIVRRWRPFLIVAAVGALPNVCFRAAAHGSEPAGGLLGFEILLSFVVGALTWPFIIRLVAAGDSTDLPFDFNRAWNEFWRALWIAVCGSLIFFLPLFVAVVIVALAFGVVRVLVSMGAAAIAAAILALPIAIALPAAYAVLSIMYPVAILEETGPWKAVQRTIRRARRDGWIRASLLGLAMLAAILAPVIGLDAAFKQLAMVPALWWVTLPGELITTFVSISLGLALPTFAALDYRMRSEGTDLLRAAVASGER